jgi:hypothetical protein
LKLFLIPWGPLILYVITWSPIRFSLFCINFKTLRLSLTLYWNMIFWMLDWAWQMIPFQVYLNAWQIPVSFIFILRNWKYWAESVFEPEHNFCELWTEYNSGPEGVNENDVSFFWIQPDCHLSNEEITQIVMGEGGCTGWYVWHCSNFVMTLWS